MSIQQALRDADCAELFARALVAMAARIEELEQKTAGLRVESGVLTIANGRFRLVAEADGTLWVETADVRWRMDHWLAEFRQVDWNTRKDDAE